MPAFAVRRVRLACALLLAALAACGDDSEPAPRVTSVSTRFRFPNGVIFVIEDAAATYGWREHEVREGPQRRVTDAELRLTLPDRKIVVTDANVSGHALSIDGVERKGDAFCMRPNGVIEPVPTPKADDGSQR